MKKHKQKLFLKKLKKKRKEKNIQRKIFIKKISKQKQRKKIMIMISQTMKIWKI